MWLQSSGGTFLCLLTIDAEVEKEEEEKEKEKEEKKVSPWLDFALREQREGLGRRNTHR